MNSSFTGHRDPSASQRRVLQVAARDLTVSKLLGGLIERLQGIGYQVEVACSGGRYADGLEQSGITVHRIEIERRFVSIRNLKAVWQLYRLIRREQYDVVHVHTPVAAGIARVAAWLAGSRRVVYTAHGFFFHDRMPRRKRWPLVAMEWFLSKLTNVLLLQSAEDMATALRWRMIDPERAVWISNGVDTQTLRPLPILERWTIRKHFGIEDHEVVIGFMGRMVAEKGIVVLEQALSELSQRRGWNISLVLLVAGDTKTAADRAKPAFIGATSPSRIENPYSLRIISAGFTDDVLSFMNALDVFVLPSFREGMPRSVLEAMSCAIPVIATDIRGCREEVVQGQTGLLVPPGDTPKLADALNMLVRDRDLRRALGDAGRMRAVEHFDESRVLDVQERVFRALLHAPRIVPFGDEAPSTTR